MISVVISEKGGNERRTRFDKPEITIGRVKGNDVLLSKGNVSKRHARLIERDGRFIVTDLKSTNGTYVNHRRITHAVIREGDRIYIGDFVLWVEPSDGDSLDVGSAGPVDSPAAGVSGGVESDSDPASIPDIPFGALAPTPSGDEAGVVTHFPIEHDPDDSGPPANGTASGGPGTGSKAPETAASGNGAQLNDSTGSMPGSTTGQHGQAIPDAEPTIARFSLPGEVAAEIRGRRATHQKWLVSLSERVEAGLGADLARLEATAAADPSLTDRVRSEVGRQLEQLQKTAGWPADLDADALRRSLLAELLDLGPLAALLGDDATTQVRVLLGETEVTRRGRKQSLTGFDFTGERAVGRVLGRLCARSGRPMAAGEFHLNRQMLGGMTLTAVRPPAAARGHMLVIHKLRRSDVSLDGLVRGGTISRGMATMLAHCMAARANLLVVGPVGSGTRRIVDALVGAVPANHRTVWLGEPESAALVPPAVAVMEAAANDTEQSAAVETAAALEVEHLVVPRLGGPGLLALVDAIGQGCEGVVLHARAASLRQGIDRLAAELAVARDGLGVETARELLLAAFDIGIEVSRVRDGRQRLCRLAELQSTSSGPGTKDVFLFAVRPSADGDTVEGTFQPTGVVPRLVEELAGRGVPLDTSIFRRHTTH